MTDRKNAQRIETIIAVVKIERTASSTLEALTKVVCLME
jgi:hypothetical protein